MEMVNGPPLMLANALVIGAPPKFVKTNDPCDVPGTDTSTRPKSNEDGVTDNCGGVNEAPVTGLALLPPLLKKVTALLKLDALVGAKRTTTFVLAKAGRLNGELLTMENGRAV